MGITYQTPKAFESAVKAKIKRQFGSDSTRYNAKWREFVFERLLSRIFSEDPSRFALKGGTRLLAQIIDARATKDIDLNSGSTDRKEIVSELARLARKDLNDFFSFTHLSDEPMLGIDTQPERSGVRVFFQAMLGTKVVMRIKLEMVSRRAFADQVIKQAPVNKLAIEGLRSFDYVLIPITQQIAEKVCATIETHNGTPSSRDKDLIDLVAIAQSLSFNKGKLRSALEAEAAFRDLEVGQALTAPPGWAKTYPQNVDHVTLTEDYRSLEAALTLVNKMLDLADSTKPDAHWNPTMLIWE